MSNGEMIGAGLLGFHALASMFHFDNQQEHPNSNIAIHSIARVDELFNNRVNSLMLEAFQFVGKLCFISSILTTPDMLIANSNPELSPIIGTTIATLGVLGTLYDVAKVWAILNEHKKPKPKRLNVDYTYKIDKKVLSESPIDTIRRTGNYDGPTMKATKGGIVPEQSDYIKSLLWWISFRDWRTNDTKKVIFRKIRGAGNSRSERKKLD